MPRFGRCSPRKDPVPLYRRTGWFPLSSRKGTEHLASTGIRSPDLSVGTGHAVPAHYICDLYPNNLNTNFAPSKILVNLYLKIKVIIDFVASNIFLKNMALQRSMS
jgi:hypothetical protein